MVLRHVTALCSLLSSAISHDLTSTSTEPGHTMKPSYASVPALLAVFQQGTCCFSDHCAGFSELLVTQLPNTTTIRSSDYVAAGTNLSIPSNHPTCAAFSTVVPYSFCRVQMVSETGPSSAVELEAWLPLNWTGRFLEVGNGGLGGCLAYTDIDYGASRGFATVGTNNGHTGNYGEPFYDNPGVLEDFAYRAIHTGAVLGKQTVEAFYGKKHSKSYYLGCSTGGRQGFMEAQNFPNDFDGITAGAPAFAWAGLMVWEGYFATITGPPGSPTFLSPELWAVVLKDLYEQCDDLDGHVDGVIEDPDLCQYKPEGLICGSENSSDCLTGLQAETVRRVFSPLYDRQGKQVYPRFAPGGDSSTRLWNGEMFPYTLDWLRYVVLKDPSWNGSVGLDEIEAAQNAETFGINAYNPDLSGAMNSGTKIMHYHGLQDELISSDNSDRYYQLVTQTMSLPPKELDEFYRYFRISGMAHCTKGTGAFNIGNRASNLAGEEAEGNVLAAMVQWVEEGKAPEYVLGTAFTDDSKDTIKFQRKHCKYPARGRYSGSGDPNVAESWECV
ncbi:tannase and feruloyl esterase [Plectosphaerella cucumerina]|uniref:Carboxylic ester hydrolase n=1 Tax=Plectosphaerella cucumerina TaxID=40658 RepID=A0A8K0X165_9PEZI|nr:tannase and feruloyl esterase [Plectosphaerella cucumerina]